MFTVFYFLHLAIGILSTNGYQHVVKVAPTVQVQGMESQDVSQYPTLCHYIKATNSLNTTSDTTVEFLPGIHEVYHCTSTRYLMVKNVSNIVWKGSQSLKKEWPMIVCNNRFNFIFRTVTNLTVTGFTMSKCGYAKRRLHIPSSLLKCFSDYWSALLSSFKFMAAISLFSVTNLNIQNIAIIKSVGYGLFAFNIMGESLINSSTFGENKATASEQAGGNAIFIFLDDSQTMMKQMLTIQNSFFYNGSDIFRCGRKCKSNQFGRQINSNGLGIITIQNNYTVKVFVHNVTFSGNFAQRNRLSILINDHSGIANSFQFINCKFVQDGALKIERNSKGNNTNIKSTLLFNVENCTFSEGVDTGIYVFLEDENFFQDIIISNCTFKHFRSRSKAVLQVVQLGISSSCSRIRMKITNSIFFNNSICSNFELTTTPYSAKKCPSIIIDNCTYENNHSPYDYLISSAKYKSLYGESDITFVEKYEEEYILNRDFLD